MQSEIKKKNQKVSNIKKKTNNINYILSKIYNK